MATSRGSDSLGSDRSAGREYPELTDKEMAGIAGLDTGGTLCFDHHDPEWVTRLATRRVD